MDSLVRQPLRIANALIRHFVIAPFIGLLVVGPAALAIEFQIDLGPGEEVPAPVLDGAAPSGEATVNVDTTTGGVTVTGSYTGMTSAVTGAHLHGPAPRGQTAGVILGLSVTGGMAGDITGGGTLTGTQLTSLLEGQVYLNVHTMNNGPGEIRGQVADDSVRLFNVSLDADQEVPAPALGPNDEPSGSAVVVVDATSGEVEVMGTYQGMTSSVTAAHIHGLAPPGVSAGVLIPLTVTGGTDGMVSGKGTLAGANLAGFFAGRTYINVHTATNGPGEIRGQITDKFIREFNIGLDPSQEVPAPVVDGFDPSGTASVIVDAVTGNFMVTGSYEGLTSAVSAAHIHGPARVGESAGVLVPLQVSGGTSGTIGGGGMMSEMNMSTLFAGRTYINVHTGNNGPGEIRGQITDNFIREFNIGLDPSQEVPAPVVAGFDPSGTASVIVDAVTGNFMVTGSYEGMTSAVSAAHIHGPARVGESAGVLVPLQVSGGTSGTIGGGGQMSEMNMSTLFAGRTYINVHTGNNGPGEIRGQITDASIKQIDITLDPDQEVPTPEIPGSNPAGTATVVIDVVARKIHMEGTYSGMSSNVIGAHLHGLANPGENAGVVVPLTVTGGSEGSFRGFGDISQTILNGLFNGQTYINVHTENNQAGEIRGQIPGTDLAPPGEGVLLAIDIEIDRETGRAVIFIDTVVGSFYDFEASRDMITFSVVFGGVPGTGERMKFQDPDFPAEPKYFRVRKYETAPAD